MNQMGRWFAQGGLVFLLLGQGVYAEVSYFHSDHLGSTSVTTNSAGAVQQIEYYTPFGEILRGEERGEEATPYLYTGQELDSESALYYLGARYVDTQMGRFLSADPIQRFSPYAYVLNNPIRLVDPDGNAAEESGMAPTPEPTPDPVPTPSPYPGYQEPTDREVAVTGLLVAAPFAAVGAVYTWPYIAAAGESIMGGVIGYFLRHSGPLILGGEVVRRAAARSPIPDLGVLSSRVTALEQRMAALQSELEAGIRTAQQSQDVLALIDQFTGVLRGVTSLLNSTVGQRGFDFGAVAERLARNPRLFQGIQGILGSTPINPADQAIMAVNAAPEAIALGRIIERLSAYSQYNIPGIIEAARTNPRFLEATVQLLGKDAQLVASVERLMQKGPLH
ncbi:MAG: hypothetical protein HY538_04725 [Deltaproteobacteria bacterium]|nr:hypothetical protein [Deltaproteobacteria bacterium]